MTEMMTDDWDDEENDTNVGILEREEEVGENEGYKEEEEEEYKYSYMHLMHVYLVCYIQFDNRIILAMRCSCSFALLSATCLIWLSEKTWGKFST